MELKDCGISILIGETGTRIEVRDNSSCTNFMRVELTPEQTCQALSRLSNTPCKASAHNLDRLGKTMELKTFTFEMPYNGYQDRKTVAAITAKKMCPDGWTPDLYFGSQDSFFTKNGKKMARTTIRRWVNQPTTEE